MTTKKNHNSKLKKNRKNYHLESLEKRTTNKDNFLQELVQQKFFEENLFDKHFLTIFYEDFFDNNFFGENYFDEAGFYEFFDKNILVKICLRKRIDREAKIGPKPEYQMKKMKTK